MFTRVLDRSGLHRPEWARIAVSCGHLVGTLAAEIPRRWADSAVKNLNSPIKGSPAVEMRGTVGWDEKSSRTVAPRPLYPKCSYTCRCRVSKGRSNPWSLAYGRKPSPGLRSSWWTMIDDSNTPSDSWFTDATRSANIE